MRRFTIVAALCVLTAGCAGGGPSDSAPDSEAAPSGPAWLAGDHHIHSIWSVSMDRETDPPRPIIGGAADYSTPMNAIMAKHYGLSWMVTTDHGGRDHARINRDRAYPQLQLSREAVPEVVQFYGLELNTPAAEHSTVIIPHTHDEAEALYQIESGYDRSEVVPRDPERNTEERMREAVTFMSELPAPPVVIANHPARTARAVGEYGLLSPAELRGWNDTASNVATGMAGAPGHQAASVNPDGSLDPNGNRGSYRVPTMGGFDQFTAIVGGFWDSMIGEGRRWWITANSDSHTNWREGGSDFYPGEYSKTYVYADKNHDDILEAIRNGRVFVTLGDLVSELDVMASVGGAEATIGGELEVPAGSDVSIMIRVRDPEGPNFNGDNPSVARVDLIAGDITGPVADPSTDANPTTRVAHRFTPTDWVQEGEYLTMTYVLENVTASGYVRVRGTSTDELEPEPDPRGEDPWADLWFYSNPIFLRVR